MLDSKYSREDVIGSGTFGCVYLVRSKSNRHPYVLKQVCLARMSTTEVDQALTEVAILSRCRHRNIIRYKEAIFEQEKGLLSIIMEFAENGDMYAAIKRQKGRYFNEDDVLSWFIQITLALQYIHNHNILHRDLKTQNIFLSRDKVIKVGDFGIARVLKSDDELATTAIGTPYYLSPEICNRKPYNCKSDIWALGCVLFEMSALVHPFQAKNFPDLVRAILKGRYGQLPSHCSPVVQDLVKILLAADPDKRPTTEEILAIPALRGYLYDYLYLSSEENVIDPATLAMIKQKDGYRRFSSDDILDMSKASVGVKRRASLSMTAKSGTKMKIAKQISKPYSKDMAMDLRHTTKANTRKPAYIQSPLADIRNSMSSTVSSFKSVSTCYKNAADYSKFSPLQKTYTYCHNSDDSQNSPKPKKTCQNSDGNERSSCDTDGGYQSGGATARQELQVKHSYSYYYKTKLSTQHGANMDIDEWADDVFETKTEENPQQCNSAKDTYKSKAPHCLHQSECYQCILNTLWKNRIRSVGTVDENERERLVLRLRTAFGKDMFTMLYDSLSRKWQSQEKTQDLTLQGIMQTLDYDQKQLIPLLMQLLQLDMVRKMQV